jgi:hypothetical protein
MERLYNLFWRCLITNYQQPEFDVRKPAKNEYSKGLEAFLERAYVLNKP